MNIQEKYDNWLEHANNEIKEELRGYSEKEIEDSFYKDLAFGTGGLRGEIGAGTNKLNVYTVGKFYLSVVVDKESRYVLGHAFGKEKDKDLVARAVDSVEEEIEFEPGTSLGLFPEIEKYLRRKRQNTYDEAVEALERYIRYYNDSRIHPELGWTPKIMLLGKGKFKELEERSGNYSKDFIDWYTSLLGDDEDDKERSA